MFNTLTSIGLQTFAHEPERLLSITPRGDEFHIAIGDSYGRYILERVPFEEVWPEAVFQATLRDMLRHRRDWNASREFMCELLHRLRLRLIDPAQARQARRIPRDPFDEFDDSSLAASIQHQLEFLAPGSPKYLDEVVPNSGDDPAAALSAVDALIARWSTATDLPTA